MKYLSKNITTILIAIGMSLFFLLPALNSLAEQQNREIVLNDGSIIHAKVLSLDNGVYRLDSDSLGTFQLEEDKIAVIRKIQHTVPEPAAAAGQKDSKEEIEDVQGSLLRNPGVIGMIFELQNDPEVQNILQDKEVMALILSGNLEALQANEKFLKLMNNPKIQKILENTKK